MPAGIDGPEYDSEILLQESAETSEPVRKSFLTYIALGMLAISGAFEAANGFAMDDQLKIFYGGVEIAIAVLACFATPRRYRRA